MSETHHKVLALVVYNDKIKHLLDPDNLPCHCRHYLQPTQHQARFKARRCHQDIRSEDALEVATDPDDRFDLAVQLGRLELAKSIATEVQSESKWIQFGKLAMSNGKLDMAEDCLNHAMDLSELLLLYSSLGDAEGISKLATLAKDQGKNNVAFLRLFMLGRVDDYLELLIER
ncbi:hypothetical protein PIB30_020785 [Stylosanthes scabra]|uniref:COPA/B TPR domain-containing protein n=1 Tax=Stylosanthes scabra TaxID=79078 RepID=A0ABU6R8X9_9FABA|nr:hypothetical protein [Stylosanthes scabra]